MTYHMAASGRPIYRDQTCCHGPSYTHPLQCLCLPDAHNAAPAMTLSPTPTPPHPLQAWALTSPWICLAA